MEYHLAVARLRRKFDSIWPHVLVEYAPECFKVAAVEACARWKLPVIERIDRLIDRREQETNVLFAQFERLGDRAVV